MHKYGSQEFIPKFQEFIEEQQLTEEMIYNADETGLYYRILPDRTLAMKKDKTSKEGYKQVKVRLMMLFCYNWTGQHKLIPLCIGKFGSSRCFHNTSMSSLSVEYAHSKNARMTAEIFLFYFFLFTRGQRAFNHLHDQATKDKQTNIRATELDHKKQHKNA